MKFKINIWFLIIILLGVLFQFFAVIYFCLNFDTAIPRLMPDDTFYYLKIAENISLGYGSVFSVGEPTNGYHPLWMILLVLVHKIFHPGKELFVFYVLCFAVFLNLIAAIVLKKLLEGLGFSQDKVNLGLVLYLFLPWACRLTLTGIETPLFLALLFLFFLEINKLIKEEKTPLLRFFLVGIFAGFLMLARTDGILVTAPVWAIIFWTKGKEYFKQIILVGLIAGVILLPWLVWNYFHFYSIIQSSGTAISLLAHASLPPFFNFKYLVELLVIFSRLLSWFFVSIFVPSEFFRSLLSKWGFFWGTSIFLILSLSFLYLKFYKKENKFPLFIWLPALLTIFFYAFVRVFIQVWDVSILLIFLLLIILNFIPKNNFNFKKSVILMLILAGINFYSFGKSSFFIQPEKSTDLNMLEYGRCFRCHEQKTLKIGCTDSGYLGYFSRHQIVNLDGVVNNRVLFYIKHGIISDYLSSQKFDEVLIDKTRLSYYDRNY